MMTDNDRASREALRRGTEQRRIRVMHVRCYEEGSGHTARDYNLAPPEAARRFCIESEEDREGTNVCVEPLDDEARALSGWHSDEDAAQFKMFRVEPVVSTVWTVEEKQTFNPFHPR